MKKIFILLVFVSISTFSQENTIKKADKYYTSANFTKAAELYSNLLESDSKQLDYLKKAADSYYYISNFEKALPLLKTLVENHKSDINDIYVFKYAQTLKASNNQTEANKWLKVYQSEVSETTYKANIDKLESIKNQASKFEIQNSSINSEYSEFGPSFYNEQLVFSAPSKKKKLFSRNYSWTNQPYLDLYLVDLKEGKTDSIYTPFSEELNSKLHEASVSFTEDGKTIYFTRNTSVNGKREKDQEKITHVSIYKAELVDGVWTNITSMPFNGVNYSTMHPCIDSKNKKIYFSSDMPGTIGSFDLFYVSYDDQGNFGKPVNLGSEINTKNKEQFPFIAKSGKLYFASDGHVGFGLLDVFVSENKDSYFTKPLNLGLPINTNHDDFSYIIDETSNKGFFASNREDGKGDDDIYSLVQIAPFESFNYFVDVQVLDENTKENIENSDVTIFDEKGNKIFETNLKELKNFTLDLKPGSYKITSNHTKYIPSEKTFTILDNGILKNEQVITMQKIPNTFLENLIAEEGDPRVITDNGVLMFDLPEILFNFDKFDIRDDAKANLDLLIDKLKRYPQIDIAIGSHTDIRGTDSYNEILSQERANSTMNYIVKNGIPADRVTAKGYGESKPKIDCSDHECNDEEHQINRRSEFVIIVR